MWRRLLLKLVWMCLSLQNVGSPVQAHKIKTAVDGSSLGAVSLSDSKLVSSPAIREAFSLPWEEDFPASPWEEVSRSGVAVIVEAKMSEAAKRLLWPRLFVVLLRLRV
jgi:hypothetical protein